MAKGFFKDYFHNYLAAEFGPKCVVAAIMLLLGSIMFLLNALFFHYQGELQFGDLFIKYAPAYVSVFAIAIYVQKECPRISLLLRAVGELSFVALMVQFYVAMAQFTPFALYDQFFYHVDLWLGYNTSAVITWMHQHKSLLWLFDFIYIQLYFELLLIPLVLAIFMLRRQLDIFLLANLLAALIGFTVYYLFPTTDPAAVIHSVQFYDIQRSVVTQFLQMHSHEKITQYVGGIVGFPSFHVIWASIAVYAVRKLKVLFIVILCLNILIIGSTFLLAWHYLSDVIGGLFVATIAISLAEHLCKQQDQRQLSHF